MHAICGMYPTYAAGAALAVEAHHTQRLLHCWKCVIREFAVFFEFLVAWSDFYSVFGKIISRASFFVHSFTHLGILETLSWIPIPPKRCVFVKEQADNDDLCKMH